MAAMPLIKSDDAIVLKLADRAKQVSTKSGFLMYKDRDSQWISKYFILYQNILFEFDGESGGRPTGMILLEHCTVERLSVKFVEELNFKYCFTIVPGALTSVEAEGNQRIFLCESDCECSSWVKAVKDVGYSMIKSLKEEAEHRCNHIVKLLESERTEKWKLLEQCEEQSKQLEALRSEILALLADKKAQLTDASADTGNDNMDLQKIKKIQNFFRGIICRRRWHRIVQDYIRSPHAESMRKRNMIVFHLVKSEEEYLQNLSCLVTSFYRPFKMSASSMRPPVSHEEVSSIFLNCETLMFLHQIFLKGLQTRMESWPTLVLGDLFDMLLPMLSIYQEYVRNHHYSLQTLTDCRQRGPFRRLLKIHEEKLPTSDNTLETLLTHPMHRIPNYIVSLHQMLALTPSDHVERSYLEHAQSVLEELSTVMHDQVSETENIRKSLSIERQFADGCEILLHADEIFIRQGTLLELPSSEACSKAARRRSMKSSDRKDCLRQCFLFSKVMLISTRVSGGKLSLSSRGTIPLIDAIVTEDIVDEDIDLVSSVPNSSEFSSLAFKIVVGKKSDSASHFKIIFLASSAEDKASWTTDISQCIENLKEPEENDVVSIASRRSLLSIRSDPRLFKDSDDLKYSRALDSCRMPRIRYASLDKLLERLLDVRFLSIEFLNTFLTTYHVFTKAKIILDTLCQFYYKRDSAAACMDENRNSGEKRAQWTDSAVDRKLLNVNVKDCSSKPSCHSVGTHSFGQSAPSGSPSKSNLQPPTALCSRRHSSPSALAEVGEFKFLLESCGDSTTPDSETSPSFRRRTCSEGGVPVRAQQLIGSLSSCEASQEVLSSDPSDGSVTCSDTCSPATTPQTADDVVRKSAVRGPPVECQTIVLSAPPKSREERKERRALEKCGRQLVPESEICSSDVALSSSSTNSCGDKLADVLCSNVKSDKNLHHSSSRSPLERKWSGDGPVRQSATSHRSSLQSENLLSPIMNYGRSRFRFEREPCVSKRDPGTNDATKLKATGKTTKELRRHSATDESIEQTIEKFKPKRLSKTISGGGERATRFPLPIPRSKSPISSPPTPTPGVVVTSCRSSHRRTSNTNALVAFAVATAGAPISPVGSPSSRFRFKFNFRFSEDVDGHVVTRRVLKILKYWVSKFPEDFRTDSKLRDEVMTFVFNLVKTEETTASERKCANSILKLLSVDNHSPTLMNKITVGEEMLCQMSMMDKCSPLQLAEQMTLLDHTLLSEIPRREFLSLSWMKVDKAEKAEKLLKVTSVFNQMSRLVATDIISQPTPSSRAASIDKWAAVADHCRCLHNFNGVLQIITAFTSSAVYRLRKTWEKVSKQTRSLIEKLKAIVSADGRFRNLREALKCCDPPCVPYLGFYLTDLAFIEEGTPAFNEDGLLNFSKMKMVANVIQEIRTYQQVKYTIERDEKVISYLLSASNTLSEEELYKMSLSAEQKRSLTKNVKFGFNFGS